MRGFRATDLTAAISDSILTYTLLLGLILDGFWAINLALDRFSKV